MWAYMVCIWTGACLVIFRAQLEYIRGASHHTSVLPRLDRRVAAYEYRKEVFRFSDFRSWPNESHGAAGNDARAADGRSTNFRQQLIRAPIFCHVPQYSGSDRA